MFSKADTDALLCARVLALYERFGPEIGSFFSKPRIPAITVIVVSDMSSAAFVRGTEIVANGRWFHNHPDDDGAFIHEFTHVVMRCPKYNERTRWLIEGIADYVRDLLGFDARHSRAHYEHGKAITGYQTTAHFLFWLERRSPNIVQRVANRLMDGTYEPEDFFKLSRKTLDELVWLYERENEHTLR